MHLALCNPIDTCIKPNLHSRKLRSKNTKTPKAQTTCCSINSASARKGNGSILYDIKQERLDILTERHVSEEVGKQRFYTLSFPLPRQYTWMVIKHIAEKHREYQEQRRMNGDGCANSNKWFIHPI